MITTFLLLACTPSDPDPPIPIPAAPELPDPTSGEPTGPVGTTDPLPADTADPFTPPTAPTEYPSQPGQPLELCINELMPDSEVSFLAEDGLPTDWIELHNPTDVAVPLGGWTITDDPLEPDKHALDPSLVIEPHGFLVLQADDRTDLGTTHVGFALSDEGEMVALYSPDGDGSVLWFPGIGNDLALARVTDCCSEVADTAADTDAAEVSCFEYRFAGTPGATNEP